MIDLILLVSLVVLNILDVVLTKKIIDRGGVELNPIVSWLMGRTSKWGYVKVGAALALGIYMYSIGATTTLAVGVAIYLGVVFWNYRLSNV